MQADRDHPFRSPVEDEPKAELLAALCKRGEGALAERVEAGLYAMSEDELEAWELDAGQFALRATETYGANRKRAEREECEKERVTGSGYMPT